MHVAITGASSGIGEALAREFSNFGASVSLVARRKENLDKLSGELLTQSFVKPLDLSDLSKAVEWIAEAEAALGPIDVMINNAGSQIVAALEETDPEAGEASIRLNLMAPLRINRAVLPNMLKRGSGTIVDISSMAGVSWNPGMYYYNAGKAGLAAASESLRVELKGTGVHVITVYPGPVHSAMAHMSFEKHGMDPSRIPTGTPEALAREIRRAVENKKCRVVYPSIYSLGYAIPALARYAVSRSLPAFLKRDRVR